MTAPFLRTPAQYADDRRLATRRPLSIGNALFFLLMVVWAVVTFGPLVWMLGNSLRSSEQIVSQPLGLPDLRRTSNYADAWQQGDLGQSLLNSLIVSVAAVVVSGLCSLLIGFAISRGRLPFSGAILTFFLVGLLIPAFSLLLPLLFQLQSAGLTSNRVGLIIVYAGFQLSLGVFLFKGAFDTIPQEYLEAALLDGASVPRMLWSVLIPMVRPTLATFSILAFLSTYNDFVFTLVLNNDPALNTLPVAILQFNGLYGTRYDLIFAAVSIATIPPLVAYLFLRKQVQTSLAAGGRTG